MMSLSSLRILLVEDNPSDALLLQDALDADPLSTFVLTTVPRLVDGIGRLQEEAFDIILADLGLPDSSGMDTFERLHGQAPDLPMVVFSGNDDQEQAVLAVRAGAQDYLVKNLQGFDLAARSIRYAIERVQSQNRLRASEKRFRSLIEHSSDAVAMLGPDGTILYQSPAATRILGYEIEEMVGRPLRSFVHPGDVELALQDRIRILATSHLPVLSQFRFLRKDGTVCWIDATSTNRLDDPDLQAIIVNYRDITERKQADEKLRESEERHRLISGLISDYVYKGKVFVDGTSETNWVSGAFEQITGYTLDEIKTLPNGFFTLVQHDDLESTLSQQAQFIRERSRTLEYRIFRKDGDIRWLRDSMQIVNIDPETNALDLIGAVQDVTERKTAEEALKESEARFSTAFFTSPVSQSIIAVDANQIVEVNDACCRLFGYSREELIGTDPGKLNLWTNPADELSALEEMLRTGHLLPRETTARVKSGDFQTIIAAIEPISWKGSPSLISSIIDITERKQAEQAIQRNEQILRLFVEHSPAAIAMFDRDMRYIVASHRFLTDYRLPEQVLTGRSHYEVFPEMTEDRKEIHRRCLAGEVVKCDEDPLLRMDGTLDWVRYEIRPWYELNGEIGGIIFFSEVITERKQAEDRLRASEAHLRKILQTTSDGFWIFDTNQRFADVNDAYCAMSGYTREEFLRLTIADVDAVEPAQAIEEHIGKLLRSGSDTFETRHRRKDGSLFDVEISVNVLSQDYGLLVCFLRDITARKKVEGQLRLGSEVMANMAEGVVLVRPLDATIIYANPKFNQMFGYDPGELIGKPISVVNAPTAKNPEETVRELLHTLEGHGTWSGEVCNIRKNGEIFWCSGNISHLDHPEYGQVWVTVQSDITERKRAEQLLAWRMEDLALLNQLNDAVNRGESLTTITERLTVESKRIFGSLSASIYLLDQPKQHLILQHFILPPQTIERLKKLLGRDIPQIDIPIGEEDHFSQVLNSDKGMIIAGFEDVCAWLGDFVKTSYLPNKVRPLIRKIIPSGVNLLDIRSVLSVPLKAGDKVLGLIELTSDGVFDDVALERLQNVRRQLTEIIVRKQVEEELRESQERYRQFISQSFEAISRTEFDQPVDISLPVEEQIDQIYANAYMAECNQAMADMYHISLDEFIGTRLINAHGGKDNPVNRDAFRRVILNGYKSINDETIEYDADGNQIWFLSNTVGTVKDGKLSRLWGTAIDITDRKKAEAALRESEEKYRSLAEASDAFIILLDAEGRLHYMNEKAAAYYEESPNDIRGKNLLDLLPEENARQYLSWALDVISTGQSKVLEAPDRSGYYRISVQPIHDEVGKVVMALMSATDITSLKQAQHELMELNRTLEERIQERTAEVRDLYENAPTGYHSLDSDGRIIQINQTELNWLGYTRDELIDRPILDILTPASIEIFRQNFPVFRQTGVLHNLELEFIRKDGSILPGLVNAAAVVDNQGKYLMSRSTMFDNSERRKAEDALRQSEETYRALFESANDGIFIFSLGDEFLRANPSGALMLGHPAAELIGMHGNDFVSSENLGNAEQISGRVIAGERIPAYERKLLRKDGTWLESEINLSLIRDASGNPQFIQSVVRDITVRKQAEAALQHANMEMERALHLRDEFLANMSHELRTPLTGILGLSEALQYDTYGALNPKQKNIIANIENNGHHLLDLINDILDVSKMEAGKLGLEMVPTPLGDICQASLQLVKGMAQAKGQSLELSMNPAGIVVKGDARRLKQIVVNLLSNAVKYSPEKSPIGLEVRADETTQTARITVWDKGQGISPENLNRLFQPFVQLDSSLARQQGGTGLGLALVKRLVEMHGGTIEVESAPGQGSRFTVSLPHLLVTPDIDPQAAEAMLQTQKIKATAQGRQLGTIMMVDDNATNILMIEDYLQSRDYSVFSVQSGADFLSHLADVHPDVILMDIQMPNMDGLEAIRRLRLLPDANLASLPVIALTALAMPGDRERCLEAGANEYLSKPVRLKELVSLIQKMLGNQGAIHE
jgi:PAS domain S-box-containing protein